MRVLWPTFENHEEYSEIEQFTGQDGPTTLQAPKHIKLDPSKATNAQQHSLDPCLEFRVMESRTWELLIKVQLGDRLLVFISDVLVPLFFKHLLFTQEGNVEPLSI